MRVIAGTARSMPLQTIDGDDTRPTTDRIKETLFNMLVSDIYDCRYLDLFAGSGAIGIEALSRGASSSVFIESNPAAIKCIKDNLAFTKLQDRSVVRRADALGYVSSLEVIDFDVIFMDPPYSKGLEKRVMEILSHKIFKSDTLIIIEAVLDEDMSYVEKLGFIITKEKKYKTNKHIFIKRG